ncbi:MAG: hypothetical protein RLZZ350_2195 [Verrucomicrobiota bacterium]|jgi:hypothetical protein
MISILHQPSSLRRLAAYVAFAFLSVTSLHAGDLSDWVVNKHQHFNQTNSGSPVFRNPAQPYEFEAAANSSAQFVVTNLTLKLPTGLTVQCYPYLPNDNYGYGMVTNGQFASEAALDAAYPTGKYVLTITTVNDGVKIVTNTLPTSVYPSAAHVSNFDAAQKINPAKDFTLTWDTFSGGTASDFIKLDISTTNGNTVFTTGYPGPPGALNGLSNSVTIPKNTLLANAPFTANLQFYKFINSDSTSVAGATGRTLFWKWTHFPIQTTNYNRIFPIATDPSVVQFGGGLSFDGTNYIAGFLSGTNVCSQTFSSNGTLVGSQVIIGGSPGFPPALASAFGQSNSLTIWSDSSISPGVDMFGQFVSRAGVKIGSPFNLLAAQGAYGVQTVKALVCDGTNFLAVWQDKNTKYFYGQIVTAAGTLSGSEFLISSQQQNGADAEVMFQKTNYLVVWQSNNNNTGTNNKTYGEFVSRSGVAGSPFQISQTASTDQNPLAIGFDGTNYLVAWNRDIGSGTGTVSNWDVFGRVVSQTGTFPGNEVAMVTNSGSEVLPALAFDGTNYLVAWGQDSFTSSTNYNIRFQFFDRNAATVGPQFTLFGAQGTNAPLLVGLNGMLFDGTRFAVAGTLGTVTIDPNQGITGIPSGLIYGTFIPSTTAAPRLTATNQLASAQFPLLLSGTPGINYAIQFSTNLSVSNWSGFITNSPTNGDYTFSFTNNQATNKNRFYRAVKQ